MLNDFKLYYIMYMLFHQLNAKTHYKYQAQLGKKKYIQLAVLDFECCFPAHQVCKSFPSAFQEL